jgi:BirA family biotin operon repressor/biotin-[acetyl-CoA-carboxylase] ligase
LALNLQSALDAPIIELDTIDSTNNYAMRLIDADSAQAGLTIVAGEQSQGKGQRGKKWEDVPSQSLLMSLVLIPNRNLDEQFMFNATISVAIANVLLSIHENWDVRIKWPNDIIINDKKAGGLLIENVIRGSNWLYGIAGLGINVLQDYFPRYLPSLKYASGKDFDLSDLLQQIRKSILEYMYGGTPDSEIYAAYNSLLYRYDCSQAFTDGTNEWNALVKSVNLRGQLEVILPDGSMEAYTHGSVFWKWNS